MLKHLANNQKNKDAQIQVVSESILRLRTDLNEIKNNEDLMKLGEYKFPGENEYEFTVTLKPRKGSLWYGAAYPFKFIIPPEFPHNKGPSVKCLKRVEFQIQIFHPNIDFEGNVCLNLLREDYSPTVTIKMIIFGLISLFDDLTPINPLNTEVAQIMKDDKQQFEYIVKQTLRGSTYKNYTFDKFI